MARYREMAEKLRDSKRDVEKRRTEFLSVNHFWSLELNWVPCNPFKHSIHQVRKN